MGEQFTILRATHYTRFILINYLDMYYICIHQVGLVDSPWKYWRRDAEGTAEVATVTDSTEHPEQTLNESFGREQPHLFNWTHNQTLIIGATQTLSTMVLISIKRKQPLPLHKLFRQGGYGPFNKHKTHYHGTSNTKATSTKDPAAGTTGPKDDQPPRHQDNPTDDEIDLMTYLETIMEKQIVL